MNRAVLFKIEGAKLDAYVFISEISSNVTLHVKDTDFEQIFSGELEPQRIYGVTPRPNGKFIADYLNHDPRNNWKFIEKTNGIYRFERTATSVIQWRIDGDVIDAGQLKLQKGNTYTVSGPYANGKFRIDA
jgi:hypothetical protein